MDLIGKEEVKYPYFKMIYPILKDSKIIPKNLLDLINTLSNVAGYKVNIQKSAVFLYTNN
jgi:hypothetical protein